MLILETMWYYGETRENIFATSGYGRPRRTSHSTRLADLTSVEAAPTPEIHPTVIELHQRQEQVAAAIFAAINEVPADPIDILAEAQYGQLES